MVDHVPIGAMRTARCVVTVVNPLTSALHGRDRGHSVQAASRMTAGSLRPQGACKEPLMRHLSFVRLVCMYAQVPRTVRDARASVNAHRDRFRVMVRAALQAPRGRETKGEMTRESIESGRDAAI